MYLRDLFSWCQLGDTIDNGDFQCLYTGTGEPQSSEIKDWVVKFLYREEFEYNPMTILQTPNHITDFLDYHLARYNEKYAQADNLAFIATFELVWPWIRQKDLEESTYVDMAILQWINAHRPAMPKIRHTNIPFRRLCEIFHVGGNMTDEEIMPWLKQSLYATITNEADLGNMVDLQAYINNFMEYHLVKYIERYASNEIEFALVVSHSLNRIGGNPMIQKWCISKLPAQYMTLTNTTSTVDIPTNTLFRSLKQHNIEELYKILVDIKCIDRKTSPETLRKFLQMEDSENKMVWIGSKQLLRELLIGLKRTGITNAKIERYVQECCIDENGNVLKLAKNKVVESFESDKVAEFLANL